MKFTTTIFTGGGNTAGFYVPDEVMQSIAQGKRFPVTVTINGYTYRNTVTTYEGKSAVGLSIENREHAKVKVGDKVEIDLVYDDKPREIEIPEDMRAELDKNPKAKEVFENLAPSYRKEYVRWIVEAKKQQTRNSRLAKLVDKLL